MPVLRATAGPRLRCRAPITFSPKPAITSPVRSLDPSSTTMTSSGAGCCPSALSIASARKVSPLWTGMTTLTAEALMRTPVGSSMKDGLLEEAVAVARRDRDVEHVAFALHGQRRLHAGIAERPDRPIELRQRRHVLS